MPDRKIFLWMPTVGMKPDKSRFEIDATDPEKATLAYEETFLELTDETVLRTKTMMNMFAKGLKGMAVNFDVSQEGNTMRLKATGPADALAGMMLGEFLFQSFDRNPEKRFWIFVDSAQAFLSTMRLPIRKLYEEYSGQSLEEPVQAQEVAPLQEVTEVRKWLAEPASQETPPAILEQFKRLGPAGKEYMFGYILGYAKATNESLRKIGKALDVPWPGMTDVKCGECGFQAPAPNSLIEDGKPFTCPKCNHAGLFKEGKF